MDAKKYAQNILDQADIKINGDHPWDIQIHNDNLYKRVLAKGSLGLGESYMDKWWDAKELDQFFYKLLKSNFRDDLKINLQTSWLFTKAKIFNLQTPDKSFRLGKKIDEIGDDVYRATLDKSMTYTCGYWKEADNLDQAQENKLDLVCKKIGLKPGDKVLDIGSGWGNFARLAAQKYGAQVVGITISANQLKGAQAQTKGLPVEFRLQDYRDVNEKFDHIVSIGALEHIGVKNYSTYIDTVRKNLKDDGLFLMHTIGHDGPQGVDPWLEKYIFPNSALPSLDQITIALKNKFIVEDLHNFGADYDKTLMAWFKNFNTAWPELNKKYDDKFYRMWKYYLLSCAGLFRARKAQLWQIVLSKNGIPGGYKSIR